MKNLSILGSTGSIGCNVLKVAEMFPERFCIKALAAKNNIERLTNQIRNFKPELVSVFDEKTANDLRDRVGPVQGLEILHGDEGYKAAATLGKVDIVVSSMVGAAGLMPTIAAIQAGKEIALANKETLVMAGEPVMDLARSKGVKILPVDSEHSAVFQCLSGQRRQDLSRIFLTASGGPFLDRPKEELGKITPRDALKHPTWEMGPKISIDSATLMNKGLEVIEAKHLFDISQERIEVLIHPKSVVHSMVEFRDGAVLAQLGIPDMKGAIAYALSYPERLSLSQPALDFPAIGPIEFREPDFEKFPCLALAYEACGCGGTMPAVLNASNETAVESFLASGLGFTDIHRVVEKTMEIHDMVGKPTLEDIRAADSWARRTAMDFIKGL